MVGSRRWLVAAVAVVAVLGGFAPGTASAAAGVTVDEIGPQQCLVWFDCDVQVTGTGLDAVTSVSTDPVRAVSIISKTPTALTLRFPGGGDRALTDLTFRAASGDVTVESAMLFMSTEGEFTPVTPLRSIDTRRSDLLGPAPVGPGGTISTSVDALGNADSVMLNVTVTEPSASGFLTVFPSDGERPTASNVNFVRGQTVPNLVSVRLSADNRFSVYNGSQGTAHVIVDVVGYHRGEFADNGGRLVPIEPFRAYDSRDDGVPFSTDQIEDVSLGELPQGTLAVAVNVTAVNATNPGFVTVFPATEWAPPNASNLNVASAAPVPNMVVVAAGSDGVISVATNMRGVDLVFDVVGVYVGRYDATPPLPTFAPVEPARVLDTRSALGWPSGPLLGGGEVVLSAASMGVPDDTVAVILNVTVTQPTSTGYLTVWPGGAARPLASSLNFVPGQTVPNLVIVPIGSDGTVRFFAPSGSTHVVADLAGYYAFP